VRSSGRASGDARRTALKKLGKYEIIEELGRGAMGVVYKARDPLIGRLIALKTITAGLADNQELLQRFYREAQSAGGLQHPNIVTVHDLGEENQTPYIAMEFIEGTSLESIIQKKAPLPLSQKVGHIVQVCRGLGYAHQRGVVHRDIKPANIMLTNEGVVKIVDFGIARVMAASKTQSGLFIGTVAYMSPEQVRGEHVDGRSDIWSVGVMFYELLTYVRPFAADNMAAMMFNIVSQETKPLREAMPQAPPELEAVLQKILKKETDDRYQSMEEVLLDLEPIHKKLQSDIVGELVTQGQQLFDTGDFSKARDVLRQAAQLDTAQTQVKHLLERVNLELKRGKVLPKLQEMIAKAQELLKAGKYSEAAAEGEAALKLDSGFGPAQELMQLVRERAEVANRVKDGMQFSRKQLAEGDLTGAEKKVEEILALEKENPQVIELKRQIQEEKTRREKRKHLGERLQRARSLWTEQKISESIELLNELDREFPNEPEVKSLLASARADQGEQEKQGRLAEARKLLGEQKFAESLAILDKQLETSPNDSSVQRLRERVLEERKEHAKRIRLHHEHLALKKLVSDANYKEAIQRANTLLDEFPGEFELTQLRDFARSQQELAEYNKKLESKIREIRALMEKSDFKQAIAEIEKALPAFAGNAELLELQKAATAKKKELDDREKKEYIEKQLRAMKVALDQEDFTGAIDLGQKTRVLVGDNKDVTQVMHLAKREKELRDRNKEATDQFKTAIFRIDEGRFDEAQKILEDVQKTHIFDPRVHKLLDAAKEKKPLPASDETRIGIFRPGAEIGVLPEAAKQTAKATPVAPGAAAAPPSDKTMVGSPQQIAQAFSGAQVIEPPASVPPPPPAAEPPAAPLSERDKKKKGKEKEKAVEEAAPAPAAPPKPTEQKPAPPPEVKAAPSAPAKPVEQKPVPPVDVKAVPPAPAKPGEQKPAPPAEVKAAPPAAPAGEKPKPAEEKKPAAKSAPEHDETTPLFKPKKEKPEPAPAAKPVSPHDETVPLFKAKKEKPAAAPAAAAAIPVPVEEAVPVWKKPAVMGIAAVLVLAVAIGGYIATRPKATDAGAGGGGNEITKPEPGPAPSVPSPSLAQERLMDEARTLMGSAKFDAAEEKLKQARGISGGTHGGDIDALSREIVSLRNDTARQAQLKKEEGLWQKGLTAFNGGKVSDARKAFDEIAKLQGGVRRGDAQDYLSKRIPDLEKADGLLSQARPLAQKKDKASLDQARGIVQQVIAMGGPKTEEARTLEGVITRGMNALAGEAKVAETAAKINELKSGAAQDIARDDFDAARAKADEIRSLGGDPAPVVNGVDQAEQRKATSFQTQFNSAKNNANDLRKLQTDLQKYIAARGRIGEAARDVTGKIPAELTRLEAASRPAPAPAPVEPAAARSASVQVQPGLAHSNWTGPLSAGQLVNNRYLDAPLKGQSTNVTGEILQRAAAGGTVQLRLDVNSSGKVTGGVVNNGDAGIGQLLINEAKSSWQLSSPLVNGKPVMTQVTVKVQF
jgi:serine/threonine-protein kinase